jgi:macrolide transport system ATP-binding/permease protein
MRFPWWGRRRREAELEDEIQSHLQMAARDRMERGESPADAERSTRKEFGGVSLVKEVTRDMWGWTWVERLVSDVRYGARTLRRTPGFTLAAILTLALGIGINTTIFSLFYGLVLRPLPVKDPGSVVNAYRHVEHESRDGVFSYPEFVYYREHNQAFLGLAAFGGARMTLTGQDGAGETVHATVVSGNYFTLLGKDAAVGRTFLPEEDQTPGSHPVAVLSYEFWQRRFAGDASLIGKKLALNSVAYTVVGVAPKGFGGIVPDSPELWVPMMMQSNAMPGEDLLTNRNASRLRVLGRLKPGISGKQAEAELTVLAKQFADVKEREKVSVALTAGSFLTPGELRDVLPVAILLIGAVSVVLLIACANIANLLLARGAVRQKEIGIRQAPGASRWRVTRQLLTENLLLALTGGAAGLLASIWAASLLVPMIHPPGERGFHMDASPDAGVLAYTIGVSLLTGLLFGVLPALRASKQSVTSTLKEESSAFGQRVSRSRLRSALVVSQVAASLFLLTGAGLLVRAMQKAQGVKLGFEAKNVLVVTTNLGRQGYDAARAAVFERQLTERLETLPGVKSVGLAELEPLGSSFSDTNFAPEGHEPLPGAPESTVNFNKTSPGYFEALGIPIVRGRGFTPEDIAQGRHVALINESLARRYWPSEDAVGKKFRRGEWEVIGVAKDARSVHLWTADEPCLFYPASADTGSPRDMKFFVRTDGNPAALVGALPETARSIDRAVQISVKRLDENVAQRIWPSQIGALLSGTLGLLALLLASLGIYGVMAYAVAQRTREIGVRMALGARKTDVLRMVLVQGMRLVSVGVAVGLLLSAAGSRLLAKFLYGLSPVDALTFAGVAVLLAAIAALACYLPARRAMRVDPIVALRYE